MQKLYPRLILLSIAALATLAFLLVLTMPGHFVATTGAPGPILPPPPPGLVATTGAPGPILPPPPPGLVA